VPDAGGEGGRKGLAGTGAMDGGATGAGTGAGAGGGTAAGGPTGKGTGAGAGQPGAGQAGTATGAGTGATTIGRPQQRRKKRRMGPQWQRGWQHAAGGGPQQPAWAVPAHAASTSAQHHPTR
jgi:hypothetical protein